MGRDNFIPLINPEKKTATKGLIDNQWWLSCKAPSRLSKSSTKTKLHLQFLLRSEVCSVMLKKYIVFLKDKTMKWPNCLRHHPTKKYFQTRFWIVTSNMVEYVNKWGETQETGLVDNWWVPPCIDPLTPPLLFLTNSGCWPRMGGLYGQCFCQCSNRDGRVNSKHLCLCLNRPRKRQKLPRH